MLTRFRNWAQERLALEPPPSINIQIKGRIDDFGEAQTVQVGLEMLEAPAYTQDLSEIPATVYSEDFALAQVDPGPLTQLFAHIFPLGLIQVPFPDPFKIPPNVDVLTLLGPSGLAGKVYGEQEAKAMRAPRQMPLEMNFCKHGIPKFACEICSPEPEASAKTKKIPVKAAKVPTVDVFALLLPFLQPPLGPLLDQPLLFPPGRRPFDYQIQGIRFLASQPNALLGDDMGLGKTIQTILAMQLLFRQREVFNALIICPLSLLGNWEREIRNWAPEFYVVKIRGNQEVREALWKSKATIFLTTYETLRIDVDRNLVSGAAFGLVVLDEAQKIKNPDAGVSRAVRTLGPKYRWGLSGTPLENKVEDVIALYRFLKPGLFRNDRRYEGSQVRKTIEPYFLRRRVKDVRKELPEKRMIPVWLDLTNAQRTAYDTALENARSELSRPDATRILGFAKLNLLKQICNLEPISGESCKVEYLMEQLDEIIANQYKALVFSQFPIKTLVEVKDQVTAYAPELFHGGMSSSRREQILKDFQEAPEPKVLLTSVKAGGVGLNLTRANHVFHFDQWWNPATARQAEARAWRIGQSEPVFVHELYTNDTIEEKIHKILMEKQQLFDEVIDDLSDETLSASAISDEELFGLFDLKPPVGLKSQAQPTISDGLTLIKRLTPAQFEHLVAAYYQAKGFKVEITGGAYDGGVDLIARRHSEIGLEHLIVQCKHYPQGQVGPAIARELLGTWQLNREATRAVLVTSGKFSEETITLAKHNRLDLIDGVYLSGLLAKANLNVREMIK